MTRPKDDPPVVLYECSKCGRKLVKKNWLYAEKIVCACSRSRLIEAKVKMPGEDYYM